MPDGVIVFPADLSIGSVIGSLLEMIFMDHDLLGYSYCSRRECGVNVFLGGIRGWQLHGCGIIP